MTYVCRSQRLILYNFYLFLHFFLKIQIFAEPGLHKFNFLTLLGREMELWMEVGSTGMEESGRDTEGRGERVS